MTYRAIVSGIGHYLPKNCVKNADLPAHLNTTDEWIRERTGITQRHMAADDETTAVMATHAAKQALAMAGIDAFSVDAIVLATTSPDHGFPATATRVQALLGASNAFAFDVQAVCSGFVYALSIADNFIKSGQTKTVLLIGAESMLRIVDWNDRSTCVLFGDGAAALVLTSSDEQGEIANENRGVLSTHLYSDGNGYDLLYVNQAIETKNGRGAIVMNGREIFKSAVKKIGEAVEKALVANNLTVADIDWFVPHQANQRIIQGVIDHFNLPPEKVVVTVDKHANTSAASIPLAMYEAVRDGRIKPGQLVLIEAMGGGLTWASAIIRW
ncbi:MAG: beta-ketoacyl-ACP synthase III [Candidatus Paracaedibacteraceae bacterium]|nr:beta-ketoacyl-ACP synthase III [Candidatus Paracaedibacteraceae bacterium]